MKDGEDFLTEFALSDDGTFAGVYGGYQRGPVEGQSWRCYFKAQADRWEALGCSPGPVS